MEIQRASPKAVPPCPCCRWASVARLTSRENTGSAQIPSAQEPWLSRSGLSGEFLDGSREPRVVYVGHLLVSPVCGASDRLPWLTIPRFLSIPMALFTVVLDFPRSRASCACDGGLGSLTASLRSFSGLRTGRLAASQPRWPGPSHQCPLGSRPGQGHPRSSMSSR